MSRLIKASSAAMGETVSRWPTVESPKPTTIAAPEESQLAQLLALIETKDKEIAMLQAAVEEARAAGEEAGRLAMELEIQDSREAQLTLLRASFEQARQDLADRLQSLEQLAVGIADAAIEKMLGEDADRRAIVVTLIRRQLAKLERHAIVAVEVSRPDFPHTAEIAALAAQLGVEAGMLVASEELASGDCRLRLKLGSADIGLGQQWNAIRSRIEALAAGEAAP